MAKLGEAIDALDGVSFAQRRELRNALSVAVHHAFAKGELGPGSELGAFVARARANIGALQSSAKPLRNKQIGRNSALEYAHLVEGCADMPTSAEPSSRHLANMATGRSGQDYAHLIEGGNAACRAVSSDDERATFARAGAFVAAQIDGRDFAGAPKRSRGIELQRADGHDPAIYEALVVNPGQPRRARGQR